MQIPENSKRILANAVREIPQSVKIWLKAASLETDINRKKNVLRKGAHPSSASFASFPMLARLTHPLPPVL